MKVAVLLEVDNPTDALDRAAHPAVSAALRLTRFRGLAPRWPAYLAGSAALATLLLELASAACVARWAGHIEWLAFVSFSVGVAALLGSLVVAVVQVGRRVTRIHRSAVVFSPDRLSGEPIDGESYGLSAALAGVEAILAPASPAKRAKVGAWRERWAATGTTDERGKVGQVAYLKEKASLACRDSKRLLVPPESVKQLDASMPCVVAVGTLRQALAEINCRHFSRARTAVLATAFGTAVLLLAALPALAPRIWPLGIEGHVVVESPDSLAVTISRRPPWPFMCETRLRFLSDAFSNRDVELVNGAARIALAGRPTSLTSSARGWVELALRRRILGLRLPDVIVWRHGVVAR